MRPFAQIATCIVVALIIALGLGRSSAQERPSRVIYPPQSLPLAFSHAVHSSAGVSCEGCHQAIYGSASSLDNNLPRESDCTACHEIDRAKARETSDLSSCVRCHPGAASGQVQRVHLPIPNLKFSHKAHLARGASCDTCHGDIRKVDVASAKHLPTMRTCLQCHDGKVASGACTTCHLAEAGLRMQTSFPGVGQLTPSGTLRGAAHDLEFRTRHKYAAQNDAGFCASCHTQDSCSECHNGIRKPMSIHTGDYVRMHAVEARRNSPDCSSCHRLQTFCQGCHSRMGVADDEKGGQFRGTGAFHPVGWNAVGLAGRGPNHHAFEAQRNIKQCASCHRESDCTKCHSAEVGSPRVNPHPRTWRGSRKCQALVKRNPRVCLRCHIQSSISCQ